LEANQLLFSDKYNQVGIVFTTSQSRPILDKS